MKINIVQNKWNLIFNQYKIFINGELKYNAKSKLFSFLSKISISDLNKKQVCTIIKDQDLSPYLNYTLEFKYGTAKIQSESFIEYFIRNSKGTLSFYEQKENLIGIFQNEKQVGTLSKTVKKVLGQDKYQIEFEKGEVEPLNLIGFAIAYDMENHSESNAIVSWDFGHIAFRPVKKVDPNWSPNE